VARVCDPNRKGSVERAIQHTQDTALKGVVHARDVGSALLDEVTQKEVLLRDYVLGVGYQ
jgi:hypothetical protein